MEKLSHCWRCRRNGLTFLCRGWFCLFSVKTAQKKILGQNHVNAIGLKMKNSKLIQSTTSQAERMSPKNHGIKTPTKMILLSVLWINRWILWTPSQTAFRYSLFCIARISLIVGGVGIMNGMYVAVTERTSEIGLKKPSVQVHLLFDFNFLQNRSWSVLGGLLGVGLGSGISWLVSIVANLLRLILVYFPTSSLILGLGISAGVGILFGYAPAGKAAKMNPIDALRKA